VTATVGDVTWFQYLYAMRERFGCNEYIDPLFELVALKQTSTVDGYYDAFENLLNLAKLNDNDALNIFITNLKLEISRQVRVIHPKSLVHAMNYARHVESLSSTNSPKAFVPYKTSLATNPLPFSHNTRTPSRLPPFYLLQIRLLLSRTHHPTNPILLRNLIHLTLKPQKFLVREERDDRRKRSLCMWCGVKFSPGHKCGVRA